MRFDEVKRSYDSIPLVMVDMDGVLADFFGAAAQKEGVKHWRSARKQKDRIDQVAKEPGFFVSLPELPNAQRLIHGVVKLAGKFSILSSPLMSCVDQSSEEKAEWLKEHFPKNQPQSVIFDHKKEKFARQADGTPNILIDDWDTNIKLWRANGGIGILYSDDRCREVLKELKKALDDVSEKLHASISEDRFNELEDKLVDAEQVVRYVKGIHNEYHLESPILKHDNWILHTVPIDSLQDPEFYDQDDPYRRVIDLDWDHIKKITPSDLATKPIVADADGWVLDGNHRVTAARLRGLKTIRALTPYNHD
jgi:5'(3')-deoxyribonucleotidase